MLLTSKAESLQLLDSFSYYLAVWTLVVMIVVNQLPLEWHPK